MPNGTWKDLCDLIDQIIDQHGGSIYDYRVQKSWDPGQAVCAELYGPNWNDDPQFLVDSDLPMPGPAPLGAIEAAERLLAGECDWMKEPDDA